MPVEPEHILILEDDLAVAEIVAEILTGAGYRTSHATTIAAAHSRLAEGDIDLVLCDLMLPDGDAEFVLRCKAPCLFMAGHPEHILRLERAGSHHIAKPFSIRELLSAIRDCLDRGKCSRASVAG